MKVIWKWPLSFTTSLYAQTNLACKMHGFLHLHNIVFYTRIWKNPSWCLKLFRRFWFSEQKALEIELFLINLHATLYCEWKIRICMKNLSRFWLFSSLVKKISLTGAATRGYVLWCQKEATLSLDRWKNGSSNKIGKFFVAFSFKFGNFGAKKNKTIEKRKLHFFFSQLST